MLPRIFLSQRSCHERCSSPRNDGEKIVMNDLALFTFLEIGSFIAKIRSVRIEEYVLREFNFLAKKEFLLSMYRRNDKLGSVTKISSEKSSVNYV